MNESAINVYNTFLIFTLDDLTFALPADQVQEILWLPELTAAPGLPDFVAGVFSLRGRLTPVIDLNLRAGSRPRPYELHHQVIVMEQAAGLVGLIVHAVLDAQTVTVDQFLPLESYQAQSKMQTRVGTSMVRLADGLAFLVDPSLVIAPIRAELAEAGSESIPDEAPLASQFGRNAAPEKRQIWHERALALSARLDAEEDPDQLALAVVRLNKEIFGLDLKMVRAIDRVTAVTPIPCCPPHVVGNINLRGDILTLLDIRKHLGVSDPPPASQIRSAGEGAGHDAAIAVVLENAGVRVGIVTDDVLDIIHLPRSLVEEVPAISRLSANNYAVGTAHHGDQVMTILDLERMLTDGSLEVNEEI